MEANVDIRDWRAQLRPESRQKILNKIIEPLKKHLPCSGPEEINELRKLASRFEEKIYTIATDQADYLQRISQKLITMEKKSQNTPSNNLQSGSSVNTNNLPAAQVLNNGQLPSTSLPTNQAPIHQQTSLQNIQSNVNIPDSAGLSTSIPPVSSLPQATIPDHVDQNANIQNISGVSQNSVDILTDQGMPSNMLVGSQSRMQGRPQVLSQDQQLSRNPNYVYQRQMHQQLLKQRLRQENLHPPHKQQIQLQANRRSVLQCNELQSPQHISSSIHSPVMQSAASSSLSLDQQFSIQQQSQSGLRQQQQFQQVASIQQPQMPLRQQMVVPSQEQRRQQQQQRQQLMGPTTDADTEQYRLSSQQNNIPSLQQQQQAMAWQSNPQYVHQHRLSLQNDVLGLPPQQQQKMLGSQPGNFSMQSNQHPAHVPQQSRISLKHHMQQPGSGLATQGQQRKQPQVPHQQMMTQQIQSQQPLQLQQQLGVQQHVNPLQHDIQQRSQATDTLLQAQNITDQQRQLYQSQRAPPENSLTSQGNWREEIYQKIQNLKETYLPELKAMHQKLAFKLQQFDSLPPQQKLNHQDYIERIRKYKAMSDLFIEFMTVPKSGISQMHREKFCGYEKHIVALINNHRHRKSSEVQSMQQTTQSQASQENIMQSFDNDQVNPQLQPMNLRNSVPKNSLSSPSPLPRVVTSQPDMFHSSQTVPKVEPERENTMSSSQKFALTALLHNPASTSQSLQPNISSVQPHSSILQRQHLKQQQEQQQHVLQNQQLKQLQHRQIQQQVMQRHQLIRQREQLQKEAKLHVQMPPQHQTNDMNDLRIRQGISTKPGLLQHLSSTQHHFSPLQQSKPIGAQLPTSSPQPVQTMSQMLQHPYPHSDQQNLPRAVTKIGAPLQSGSPPFVVLSPITPLTPFLMAGDLEKSMSIKSPFLIAADVNYPQNAVVEAAGQPFSNSTAVTSSSPLLDLTGQICTRGNIQTTLPPELSVERPIDRLIKAFQAASSKSLAKSIDEIGSVVSMMDRIAGSSPDERSKAAGVEDLAAMTKCRLQARNFTTCEGTNVTKKTKRFISAEPLDITSRTGSTSDSYKPFSSLESEVDSTASSCMKRLKIEPEDALLREIKEINQRLIDTVVDICDEDDNPSVAATAGGSKGTVVRCSYAAVALSPTFKAQYTSGQMPQIQPLRLLVPANYPGCSPILLDKFHVEAGNDYEDLSAKTRSRFSVSLRTLSEPMSLKDIARTWDACARAAMAEHAEQSGGGTFSSKYSTWENCQIASQS